MTDKLIKYYLEILTYFNKNSTFKQIVPLSKNKKNEKNETIKFTVFNETSKYGDKFLIIIFHKDTNIKATCEYIKKKHNDNLLKLNNHIIMFFRGARKTEKDEEIINSILKPKKTFKIEELLKDISENFVSDIFDKELFVEPSAFVFPKIKYFDKKDELFESFVDFQKKILDKWFVDKEKSILVIKGQGGIGKTTIAKYFANYFLKKYEHTSKIFIDSHEAKTHLINDDNKRTTSYINLFELYKASIKGGKYLDSKLFTKNLDAGNFFLIIDGIDELISKVKDFDINAFLDSIKDYYSEIKNTKIIITCRTYFWDKEKSYEYKIDLIEIQPFTLEQSTDFFEKSFKNDSKKINYALRLAKDFHKNKKTLNNYHPYALDLISKIVKTKKNFSLEKNIKFSSLLNPKETIDYIVDRICNRENFLRDKVRILDLNVDEQIEVFKNIAVKHNGIISIEILEKCISNSISVNNKKNIPKSLTEAFKTHLLVEVSDDILTFKYDFLTDFFKSVYIANYLDINNENEKVSDDLMDLFKISGFGSSLTREVPRRIINWGENEMLKLSDLITQINKINIKDKFKIYSGIFNIAFSINNKFKTNNTIENTALIENLFGSGNEIINLALINVFDNNFKIKFDFSNKIIRDCHFENYPDFWNCTFNENVYFTNSVLKKLGVKNSKKTIPFDIIKNVDKNCKYDSSFKLSFEKTNIITEEYKKDISNFTLSFLRFFYTRGTLWSRNYKDDQGKYNTFVVDYSSFGDINIDITDFLELMKEINLIRTFFHNKHQVEKIELNNKYKSDIIKYLEEQTNSDIINLIEETIYNFVRE